MLARFQPRRAWQNLVVVLSWVLVLTGGMAARGATPHWLSGTNQAGKARLLSRSFSIAEPVQRAELKLAADFCTAAVAVNGQPVISVEPYCPLQVVDVTRH